MKKSENLSLFSTPFWILLLYFILVACEPDPPPPPQNEETQTFQEVISDGGKIVNPSTFETEDSTSTLTSQPIIDGEIWACKDFMIDISQNSDDFVLYSSTNAEIIYPGNFLKSKSVSSGGLDIIPLKRGPGTITINTLNGSPSVTETVDEVSFSKITQATNNLIGSNNGTLFANISVTREEVRSLEELGVKMNAEFSNLTTKVKGSFDYNSSQSFSSVFVKVTQSLYSIVTDIPDVKEAFHPSVTAADLAKHVYPGNPATYISTVSYGRIFYLLIQSTESAEEIKAAIDVSFKGVIASGQGKIDIKEVSNLSQVKISGYAYGGDANLASGALIGDMEDVKNFIEKGGSINNGAPISYVIRSLEDPSIVVASNLTTKYTVTECENVTGGIPSFTDSRNSIDAACFAVGNTVSKMELFDANNDEFVGINYKSEIVGPFKLWQWGNDHTHPFRNTGVGAALNVRSDNNSEKTYFFSKDGLSFVAYTPAGRSFSRVFNTWEWGTDNSCPFQAIGAAVDVSVGNREIACLFNFLGTEYTLFESGQFTSPRPIQDLQIRNRDTSVEIPFSAVSAALRLHVADDNGNDLDRDIVAIFNEEGNKYVYFDMDKNVIVGPLDL